jgi:hypothetical protein
MSITEKTILAYRFRGSLLWKRAEKEYECDNLLMRPIDFSYWLIQLLPSLMPSSRRQYLASSREWLSHSKSDSSNSKEVIAAFDDAINYLQPYSSSSFNSPQKTTKKLGKTSSQKLKQFKEKHLVEFRRAAVKSRRKWAIHALIFLTANIVVGLRPSEWRNAYFEIIDGNKFLVVVNGKNTNERSHGEHRHLNLTNIDENKIKFILKQLEIVSQHKTDDSWLAYYNGIRLATYHIVRSIFPKLKKYPSLYSTRHQFAADAKASGFTKCEVAALMGHAVDTTATMHYGRKRHGSGSFGVKPAADEVARIRVRSEPQSSNKPKM